MASFADLPPSLDEDEEEEDESGAGEESESGVVDLEALVSSLMVHTTLVGEGRGSITRADGTNQSHCGNSQMLLPVTPANDTWIERSGFG